MIGVVELEREFESSDAEGVDLVQKVGYNFVVDGTKLQEPEVGAAGKVPSIDDTSVYAMQL